MLGNIKIRIKNPEHSACVQKKLFEMGFEWSWAGAYVKYAEEAFLYAKLHGGDKILSYSSCENHFKNHSHEFKEHIFTDEEIGYFPEGYQTLSHHQGEVIIKNPSKPPVALRPRYLANLQRMEEILEAMARYVEAKKRIPSDWLTEFDSLNQGIPEESFEKTMGRVLKGGRL